MTRAEKNNLSKRWTKEKISLVDSVFASSSPDTIQLKSVFGTIERDGGEWVDLRCFPFMKNYSNKTLSNINFERCVWESTTGIKPIHAICCSFSHSKLDGALNTRFESCDFCAAKLVETRSVPDTSFLSCDFRDASFRTCRFYQCSFKNCTFASAKFLNTEFDECVFDQCDFTNCNFKRCSFGGSRFLRSKNNFRYNRYAGDTVELTEKIFNPNFGMVDFKDTLMGKIKFR